MSDDIVKRLRFSGEYVTYTPTERCVTPMPPDDLRIAAADEIERLRQERDEARALVAEANNCLFGSQGYFHSSNGGAFDKHHLSRAIEDLKRLANTRWQEIERLRAQVAKLREALVRFADYADKTDRLFTDPMWSDWEPIMITLGSCRRARAALKGTEQ